MSLTIGPVTDALVAVATAAVTGIAVMNEAVQVVDGQAEEPGFAVFAIGATEPPPDGVGEVPVTRGWSDYGDRYVQEDYALPCYIDVRVPGTSQKEARDDAEAIFNAFWTHLLADLSLGGAIVGGQPAEVIDFRSVGSNVGSVAEPGRRQLITFGVHCLNLTR